MRYRALVVFVGSLLAATYLCTTVDLLSSPMVNAVFQRDTSRNAMLIGDVHHLLLIDEVWEHYPSVPPLRQLGRLIDGRALLMTAALIAIVVWFLRRRWNSSWITVGLAAALVSIVPYVVGRVVLRDNAIPERCGPWLATMLLGAVYPLLACCVFAALELMPIRSWKASR